jgi:hypothetical protein
MVTRRNEKPDLHLRVGGSLGDQGCFAADEQDGSVYTRPNSRRVVSTVHTALRGGTAIEKWLGGRRDSQLQDGLGSCQNGRRPVPMRKKDKCIQFLPLNAVTERALSDHKTTEAMPPTRPATQTPNHVKCLPRLYMQPLPLFLSLFFLSPHSPLYSTSTVHAELSSIPTPAHHHPQCRPAPRAAPRT